MKVLVASLAVLFFVLQFLGPRNHLALIPQLNVSCYSGNISFLERNPGSCITKHKNPLGFPIVFNNPENPLPFIVLVLVVDMLPLAGAALFMRR